MENLDWLLDADKNGDIAYDGDDTAVESSTTVETKHIVCANSPLVALMKDLKRKALRDKKKAARKAAKHWTAESLISLQTRIYSEIQTNTVHPKLGWIPAYSSSRDLMSFCSRWIRWTVRTLCNVNTSPDSKPALVAQLKRLRSIELNVAMENRTSVIFFKFLDFRGAGMMQPKTLIIGASKSNYRRVIFPSNIAQPGGFKRPGRERHTKLHSECQSMPTNSVTVKVKKSRVYN